MSGDGRTYRVLTYSHDGYGLGHLRRNLRLIAGLLSRRRNVCVLAVTGCKVAHEFDYPPGVDYLRLPAVTKLSDSRYVADGLAISSDHVVSLRSSIITAAADRFEPDVVLVDRHPLGLNGELADALRVIRARHPATRVVLGLRDVIDVPAAVRAEWSTKGHTATVGHVRTGNENTPPAVAREQPHGAEEGARDRQRVLAAAQSAKGELSGIVELAQQQPGGSHRGIVETEVSREGQFRRNRCR